MQLGIAQNSKDLAAKIQAINEQILGIIERTDNLHNEESLARISHMFQENLNDLSRRLS